MFRISILPAMIFGLSMAAAGPLQAQTDAVSPSGEEIAVRVDIGDIGAELASELGMEADALPRSVEVPVSVAATVCDIPVEQLEQIGAAEQHLECKAVTLTPDLADATGEQLER